MKPSDVLGGRRCCHQVARSSACDHAGEVLGDPKVWACLEEERLRVAGNQQASYQEDQAWVPVPVDSFIREGGRGPAERQMVSKRSDSDEQVGRIRRLSAAAGGADCGTPGGSLSWHMGRP